jgi:UDP-glucose 4-epimerase
MQSGYAVRVAVRSDRAVASPAEMAVVGVIDANTDWDAALQGVDSILHLAARAHVLQNSQQYEHLYFETNERGTRCLAQAAKRLGVRRFVYLSSVKVNGEGAIDRAYSPEDVPSPQDAYGMSKWLGEQALVETARDAAMEAVIVRSPLVYGPGVRANFFRLLHWVDKGWPLPLGAVNNRRSLVYVRNLCELLARLVTHPAAAGRTWMVSDGEDLSTPELIRGIGAAMNRSVHLLQVPVPVLQLCGRLLRRGPEIERLCGSLTVDSAQTRRELEWSPSVSTTEALARTVDWYLREGRFQGARQ